MWNDFSYIYTVSFDLELFVAFCGDNFSQNGNYFSHFFFLLESPGFSSSLVQTSNIFLAWSKDRVKHTTLCL